RSAAKMSRLFAAVACCSLFVAVAPAAAQNAALDAAYGDGVHAYFAGDYARAFQYFTSAAQSGSNDPRVYYFRRLSCLRLGREPDAMIDFGRGAKFELGGTDRYYDVSRALERVQGRDRLVLERQRSQARLLAQRELEQRRFDRYERIRKVEPAIM